MKKLLIILATLMYFILPVYAEEYFDPAYYASSNPDVVNVYGKDPDSLYRHYLTFGKQEGRYPNKKAAIASGKIASTIPYQTYIDVNITNQTVTYFENGLKIMEGPCVTGDIAKKNDTPKGVFQLMTHKKGKYLNGPTWHVWVDYWMCFTENACGLHDASWRDNSEFGGTTYLSNGSRGCVNLPHKFCKELFEKVSVGTIVYVHD